MNHISRLETIKTLLEANSSASWRIEQIKEAIFSDKISRYSQISNLPKDLKEQIINALGDEILTLKLVHETRGDQAHKVLFETADHHQIEAVRLSYKLKSGIHHSLCISTQSGCALGCLFCATGAIGFRKNLTADEILDQVLYFRKNNLPVDSIIFMGMGEPFSNPDNTFTAIDLMTNKDLLGISPRHLSISTVGIVPGIERLTRDYPNVNLAFSLHNPFNDERAKLMPITTAYPIEKVMAAIDQHLTVTNRKVFLAYILLKDVNDSIRHAQALAKLVCTTPDRRRLLHVNLIKYNSGNTLTTFQKPTNSVVEKFQAILTQNRIHHTMRQDFGTDINAACGQLVANYKKTT
jgi:23S rRNA (adenine-C8)-methyltransferase